MEIKTVGDLIVAFAEKAGIDKNDKHLIDILSSAELSKVPIHSELTQAMDEKLINIDVAKDNHPEIGSKYKSEALNALDKTMLRIMDDRQLPDVIKNDLLGIKSSYKRFEALVNKINEEADKKAQTLNETDKNTLSQNIDKLQAELKKEKEEREKDKTDHEAQRKSDRIDYRKRNMLNSGATIYDELDPEVKYISLSTLVDKALSDKNLEFTFDDKGDMQLLNKDGTKHYGANNTVVTPKAFVDSLMAQNKIWKVTTDKKDDEEENKNNHQRRPFYVNKQNDPAINGNNQTVAAMNKQNREAYQAVNQ